MKYLHWVACQLNVYKHLIPPEDLFYETDVAEGESTLNRALQDEQNFIKEGQIVTKRKLLRRSEVRTHQVSKRKHRFLK